MNFSPKAYSGSGFVPIGQADGRTDKRDESCSRRSQRTVKLTLRLRSWSCSWHKCRPFQNISQNTTTYYIIATSGLHVSTLSSHPQALQRTDPRISKCIVHSGIPSAYKMWCNYYNSATYSVNWLVFITEMKSVYSAVRTRSLNKAVCASSLKG